jgi:hypothetical protein
MNRCAKIAALVSVAALALTASACHSYHVDVTVENRTGAALQELEIGYGEPIATFGANALAPGQVLHYRVQLRGTGAFTAQYNLINGKTVHMDGPTVSEGQEGQLKIVLEPAGKAEFLPQLSARH